MTRKHYIELAETIFFKFGQFDEELAKQIAEALSIVLEKDNGNFNKDKFITACKDGL